MTTRQSLAKAHEQGFGDDEFERHPDQRIAGISLPVDIVLLAKRS